MPSLMTVRRKNPRRRRQQTSATGRLTVNSSSKPESLSVDHRRRNRSTGSPPVHQTPTDNPSTYRQILVITPTDLADHQKPQEIPLLTPEMSTTSCLALMYRPQTRHVAGSFHANIHAHIALFTSIFSSTINGMMTVRSRRVSTGPSPLLSLHSSYIYIHTSSNTSYAKFRLKDTKPPGFRGLSTVPCPYCSPVHVGVVDTGRRSFANSA